ncbi:MAG: hypothetical protein E7277_01035 [Lachnospiraceae bacterium]|nr:hypothetical protein [Lachnospiraceae bacterium]
MKKMREKWIEKIEDIFVPLMQAVGTFFLVMKIFDRKVENADLLLLVLVILLLAILFWLIAKKVQLSNCGHQGLEH